MLNGGIRVQPELMLGVEAGGSVISYSQNASTNNPTIPGRGAVEPRELRD